MVAGAIRKGTLERKPCAVCGTTKKVQAHHPDYRQPLEVIWLCQTHHLKVHAPVYTTDDMILAVEYMLGKVSNAFATRNMSSKDGQFNSFQRLCVVLFQEHVDSYGPLRKRLQAQLNDLQKAQSSKHV